MSRSHSTMRAQGLCLNVNAPPDTRIHRSSRFDRSAHAVDRFDIDLRATNILPGNVAEVVLGRTQPRDACVRSTFASD